ncbi:hypothetical protein Salat_2151200 [Sesamum alatum]|uniref:Uncharacterized protein n=1 Tax=Sesamum alatum TaxID=300844 RepID=A0AAE1Y1I2_9LAMI|nr:hypothetical protein Salat_2151200 [Sesamum alatum]
MVPKYDAPFEVSSKATRQHAQGCRHATAIGRIGWLDRLVGRLVNMIGQAGLSTRHVGFVRTVAGIGRRGVDLVGCRARMQHAPCGQQDVARVGRICVRQLGTAGGRGGTTYARDRRLLAAVVLDGYQEQLRKGSKFVGGNWHCLP